ncbi:MAG: hypothetical protein E7293_05910 [Lachnospiraceae bacterium]|nr:hypothetical protein [Lachnospiraceae bacterium]
MAENNMPKTLCKSVFKSGENTISKQDFTKIWIQLINTLEKGKSLNSCNTKTACPISKEITN